MDKNGVQEAVESALNYIDAVLSGRKDSILSMLGPGMGKKSPKTIHQYQREVCSYDYGKRTVPVAEGSQFAQKEVKEVSNDLGDWVYVTFSARDARGPYDLEIGLLEIEGQWYVCDVQKLI